MEYLYSLDEIRRNLARTIQKIAGIEVSPDEITAPPKSDMGDLAFGCFRLAKALGKTPVDIAKELAEKLPSFDSTVEKASAAGPYLNIDLLASGVVPRVLEEVELMKDEYGLHQNGEKGTILFEYANPNTHKEIHIGHLRNFIAGVSLVRILQAAGKPVVPVSYINDVGANVGKCVWWLVRLAGVDPKQLDEKQARTILANVPKENRNSQYLGALYTESTRAVEADEALKENVSFVQTQLEAHVPAWEYIWSETRRWCVDELYSVFDELGVKIERQYFESDVIDESQGIVDELLAKGVAVPSEGAIIVNLEDEKLGVSLLRKSDGNLLYSSKDLALSKLKLREYPDLVQSFVLVDLRQALYFKQLSATLRRMGITVPFDALLYELVKLKEGAMSSRKGNIVTYTTFRDEIVAYARAGISERHADWNEEKIARTAWALAMGGLKYGVLKQDMGQIYTFDKEQALSFDGATGPYVQYAATRLCSILRKANWDELRDLKRGDATLLKDPIEKRLAMMIGTLPSIIVQAANELRPLPIVQWCLDMATRSNEFYRDIPVLQADEPLMYARLRLVASARLALMRGLDLLGISSPEEM